MGALPLHPAVVHLPLGLAVLMPLIAAGFAWAVWTGRIGVNAWWAVVALQVLLVGSGYVAMRAGHAEEERVEAVVDASMIHEHEELAEQFVWGAGATLAIAVLVFVVRKSSATPLLMAAVVLAAVAVAALAVRTGQAGGELVYVHGAASAYDGRAK
jgi:uncharacterized membrane protein